MNTKKPEEADRRAKVLDKTYPKETGEFQERLHREHGTEQQTDDFAQELDDRFGKKPDPERSNIDEPEHSADESERDPKDPESPEPPKPSSD